LEASAATDLELFVKAKIFGATDHRAQLTAQPA
jgi:hypothetical protein